MGRVQSKTAIRAISHANMESFTREACGWDLKMSRGIVASHEIELAAGAPPRYRSHHEHRVGNRVCPEGAASCGGATAREVVGTVSREPSRGWRRAPWGKQITGS